MVRPEFFISLFTGFFLTDLGLGRGWGMGTGETGDS